jgi:acetyltransferase-like isoleucine patch superfamily enzyme
MNDKDALHEEPRFDEKGMTQWYWRVLHPENLKLGRHTQIGSFTTIDALCEVEIEDYVLIGFGCAVLSYSSIDKRCGKVKLERHSRIGSNSTIMPGTTIGKNSIVGANSFVNQDVPPNETWAGAPARFLKDIVKDDKE